MRRQARGFTLIEVMVVVVIVAILAAIALPSFQSAIRKSRRAEAHTFLQAAQLAQEKYRLNHSEYFASTGSNFSAATGGEFGAVCAAGNLTSCASTNGYYRLSSVVANTGTVAGTNYALTATAIGSQSADSQCATITVVQVLDATLTPPAVKITYGGASEDCWRK